jgi:RNA-binding protein YhbY
MDTFATDIATDVITQVDERTTSPALIKVEIGNECGEENGIKPKITLPSDAFLTRNCLERS